MDRFSQLLDIWNTGREAEAEDLPTLDDLRAEKCDFLVNAVLGRTNALCLFCAMCCGRSDVIWVHDARVEHATLVDADRFAMAAMRCIYPPHWAYWTGDYREFLAQAEAGGFDLVVADQPHVFGSDVALDWLPHIAKLAAPRFRFIANYWPETVENLGAAPDDMAGLSSALSERVGLTAHFREMLYRGRVEKVDLYWAVIDIEA